MGALWAQTPPVATPGQASNSLERKQEPPRRFLWPSNRHLFLPPTGEQESLATNPPVQGLVTVAPGGECAIPLINVAPKGGFNVDPRMSIPVTLPSPNIDHMPVVRVLPACEQAKR